MAISYIGYVISSVGFSGTSQSVNIHNDAQEGDLLVLSIMHRDALTVPPAGWTHLDTAGPTVNQLVQYESVYYKIAEESDITAGSVSVTQDSSARLELTCVVYRATGTWSATGSNAVINENTSSPITLSYTGGAVNDPSIDIQNSTTSWNGVGVIGYFNETDSSEGLFVATVGFVNAATSGSTEILYTTEDSFTRIIGSSTSQRRHGYFHLLEKDGNPQVNQSAVLVLWGTGSVAQANQAAVLVLSSFPRKRIIGITD